MKERDDYDRELQRNRDRRWRENNPERAAELARARALKHYKNNREKVKAAMRKRANSRYSSMSTEERRAFKRKQTYGITEEQYQRTHTQQGGVCACCKGDGGKRGLFVDHCHTTKKFRGLLCHYCNVGLGCAKDDVQILQAMIVYLQQSDPLS